jgi:cytochrome c5
MMPYLLRLVATALILSFPLLATGLDVQAPPSAKVQTTPPKTTAAPSEGEGDRVFQENCSRCHQPPMAISPRMTGAVIMHMRVRARLSRKDEQLLLRFLAP